MSSRWERQHLSRLQVIVEKLLVDEQTIRPIDPVRADHLAEAVADARTLISRLETAFSAESDERRDAAAGRPASAQPEQERSIPPRKWHALPSTRILPIAI